MSFELMDHRTAVWNPVWMTREESFFHRNHYWMSWVGWSSFWAIILVEESGLSNESKFGVTLFFILFIMVSVCGAHGILASQAILLGKELDSRLDIPSIVSQYQVDISIYTNGVLTGEDQGCISCLDDFLVFQGIRTSFSLRNSDCHPIWPGTQYNRSKGDLISWRNGQFRQQMRIRELDKSRAVFGVDPLQNDIRTWMSRKAEEGTFSTYPPFSVNQAIVCRRSLTAWVAMFVLPISVWVSHLQDPDLWLDFLWPLWGYCFYLMFEFLKFEFKTRRLSIDPK